MGCPIDDDFTLGDIAVERFTCVPAKSGKSTRVVTVAVGLTFRAGLKLEGVIHVGHMKAKGYAYPPWIFREDQLTINSPMVRAF